MKFLKTMGAAVMICAISISAHAADANRLTTEIQVQEFNQVASKYYEQPTFLYIIEKKKSDRLKLAVDFNRKGPAIDRYTGKNTLTFSEKRVDEYIANIDKYLKWETIAKADGDIFTKKIGRVKANSSAYNFFEFHSGNENEHYLVITSPSLAATLTASDPNPKKDPDFVFDRENAERLKTALEGWKSGIFDEKINVNIDDKYK